MTENKSLLTLPLFYSTIIMGIFILVIDLTKSLFKKVYTERFKKQNKKIDNTVYNIEEFKYIFVNTLVFIITLIFILDKFKSQIGFDVIASILAKENSSNILIGSLFIFILNSTLFFGFIIQLFLNYEELNLNKHWLLLVKENFYGPILEEILYRGIIFNFFLTCGYSNFYASLISSLMFGICTNFINF